MSENNSDKIAEAIKEQTDLVRSILLGILIGICIFGGMLFIPMIIGQLFPPKIVPMEIAVPNENQPQYSELQAIQIEKYQEWCTKNNHIWIPSSNDIPYCENTYGEKIHP